MPIRWTRLSASYCHYKYTLAMLSTSWRSKVSVGKRMTSWQSVDVWSIHNICNASLQKLQQQFFHDWVWGYFSYFRCPFYVTWDVHNTLITQKPSYASITKWKSWNTFCNSPAKWLCNGRIWNSDCIKWAGTPEPSNILNTKFIFILNHLQIKIYQEEKKKVKHNDKTKNKWFRRI